MGGGGRLKLHADIAHPINADCRQEIQQRVVEAYHEEVEKSRRPGYVPPNLDGEDMDLYDAHPVRMDDGEKMHYRRTGTTLSH